jgi:predicted nucleotidyltransferase
MYGREDGILQATGDRMSVSFEEIDGGIQGRVKTALAIVGQFGIIVETYLFGAHTDGTAEPGSDIDMAVFVEDLASWDPMDQIEMASKVQRHAGEDIEVHLLPAVSLQQSDDAGFAAWVLTQGVKVSS